MQVKEWVDACREELYALREDLHRNPELSHQEHRTSALIRERLRSWDIPVLDYQLDTGDTSASAPVLVIGFEKSKFFEDSLPVHILLTIPEHQVRIQLTGTVSAQTVVLTAPTSRMKDEDIQTLVQIRDTIQSVLQFVQSTADSMQKAG